MPSPSNTPAPKRRWLTFSLRTFLVVTLALSLVLGYFGRAWLKAYRDSQPPTLYELAQIAKRHGIPMPPKEARLVLARGYNLSRYDRTPVYSPAFLLEESDDGAVIVLRGSELEMLAPDDDDEPQWREFSLNSASAQRGKYIAKTNHLSALVCVAQLAERGDSEDARALFERIAVESGSWAEHPFNIGDDLTKLRQLVGECAYDHLEERLRDFASWRDVRTRLETLFAEFPGLNMDGRDMLLRDLVAALDAPPPTPDSTEALLIAWSRRVPADQRIFHDAQPGDANEPARQIVLRGFAAIQELVDLSEDQRLTMHREPYLLDGAESIKRVGDLAGELLVQLRAMDADSNWREGWQTPSEPGERAFFLNTVFDRSDGRITDVYEGAARVLATRYPEEMRGLCEVFSRFADPDLQPFALTNALADAKLSAEDREQVFVEFAQRGSLAHRRAVLQTFAKLNTSKCAAILLPVLESLPSDSEQEYWTCPEAAFTHVVMLLDDPAVWRAYLKAARRSSVGLRMEMMNPMDYEYIGDRNRDFRLAFLASFLEDDAIRDKSQQDANFQGPCAAFMFPIISVRNMAAMTLAPLLDIDANPDSSWTPEQWSDLRNQVRERLKQEKLPALE
jgi:hypothetical protein